MRTLLILALFALCVPMDAYAWGKKKKKAEPGTWIESAEGQPAAVSSGIFRPSVGLSCGHSHRALLFLPTHLCVFSCCLPLLPPLSPRASSLMSTQQ